MLEVLDKLIAKHKKTNPITVFRLTLKDYHYFISEIQDLITPAPGIITHYKNIEVIPVMGLKKSEFSLERHKHDKNIIL